MYFRTRCLSPLLALTLASIACGPKREVADSGLDVEATATASSSAFSPGKTDVIVQLFNWPFAKIEAELPLLSQMGYAQIHVSPPSLSIEAQEWWGRYQPVDYRKIEGPLGNESEFRSMIATAHRYGIKIIADLVLNHTANPISPLPASASELKRDLGALFTEKDYNPAFCIQNWDNAIEVRNGRLCGGPGDQGLPDLNQNSPHVLQVQQNYIRFLNSMGVDGYRLDAVKHMEPQYFQKLLNPELIGNRFVFGEIIANDSAFERDLTPYLSQTKMSLYDFPLRDTIQKAFAPGADLGLLVSSNLISQKKSLTWDRAVTFVMNHDIPNNEGFRYMILDPKDEMLAYAYLLGRAEGVPYIYSDLGIQGGGGLKDDRWKNAHRNPLLGGMIKFHNAVHSSPSAVAYADTCTVVVSRENKGFFAINKCSEDFQKTINLKQLPDGSYQDTLSSQVLQLSNHTLNLKVPARTAKMFLKL